MAGFGGRVGRRYRCFGAAREGLPTAFQEASSHEVAILAYVNPGNYVGRFGHVVPEEGGLETLEQELRRMIETDDWHHKGKAGRVYNLEHHSIPVVVAEHMKIYRSHLGDAHSIVPRSKGIMMMSVIKGYK